MKSYKRKGKIFKKKSADGGVEEDEEIEEKKEERQGEMENSGVQYIYCPYFIFVPVPYGGLVNFETNANTEEEGMKMEIEGNGVK